MFAKLDAHCTDAPSQPMSISWFHDYSNLFIIVKVRLGQNLDLWYEVENVWEKYRNITTRDKKTSEGGNKIVHNVLGGEVMSDLQ